MTIPLPMQHLFNRLFRSCNPSGDARGLIRELPFALILDQG